MTATCVVCQSAATVWCENDKAFLCDGCDVSIHSTNVLASRHSRYHVCGTCRTEVAQWTSPEGVGPSWCSGCQSLASVAGDAVPAGPLPTCDVNQQPVKVAAAPEADAGCLDATFLAPSPDDRLGCPSPTGSEAVVPVMSPSLASDFGALVVPSFKDLKDLAEEFKVMDGDSNWLDLGFDFSDILSEGQDDAALVPNFKGDAFEEVSPVPAPAPVPAPKRLAEAPVADEPASKAPAYQMPMYMYPPGAYAMAGTVPYPSAHSAAAAAAAHAAALAAGANLTREQRVARYREKRKHRKFEKTIRYASRKAYAEIRPRIKGRFARKDEIEAWKAAHGGDDAVVPEVLDA